MVLFCYRTGVVGFTMLGMTFIPTIISIFSPGSPFELTPGVIKKTDLNFAHIHLWEVLNHFSITRPTSNQRASGAIFSTFWILRTPWKHRPTRKMGATSQAQHPSPSSSLPLQHRASASGFPTWASHRYCRHCGYDIELIWPDMMWCDHDQSLHFTLISTSVFSWTFTSWPGAQFNTVPKTVPKIVPQKCHEKPFKN